MECQANTTPQQFHLFNQLPTELRFMVWSEASQASPRIMEIFSNMGFEYKLSRAFPIPSWAEASYEAHNEWNNLARNGRIKAYKFAKDVTTDDRTLHIRSPREVSPTSPTGVRKTITISTRSKRADAGAWFDTGLDTLYWNSPVLAGTQWFTDDCGNSFSGVRNLMLRRDTLALLNVRALMRPFPDLQTITFYLGGVDLDARVVASEQTCRHVLVDMGDKVQVGKITSLINRTCGEAAAFGGRSLYSKVQRIDTMEEWRSICQRAQDRLPQGFWRNIGGRGRMDMGAEYYRLDGGRYRFAGGAGAAATSLVPWSRMCRIQEQFWLGDRYAELAGVDHENDIGLQMAHTEAYCMALEGIPEMRQVAMIRILGDLVGIPLDNVVQLS
ncbi:hypothetical protein BX600DRAFT_540953 [Xylariales sp. PMI_506]|nr:hypothetical protein BX600DRAFT_540953 [Xylariales sp. PMI_506]